MKILFLLNRVQKHSIEAVKLGKSNDSHLYGLLKLQKYDIETDYLEIEQFLPENLCKFIRRFLNVYWIHLPLFFKFRKYDIVYTSTAFGTQLVHALYPFKKPKWVMLDFSITGLIGDRKTFKQKIFYYITKKADGIVTIGEKEADQLREMFPEKKNRISFIPFSIDTNHTRPDGTISESGENIIFCPGRDPGRDFATLFEATRDIDAKVIITTRKWTLEKYLPLPRNVIHADLDQKEFFETYNKAKIVVIPLDTSGDVNNAMGCSTLVEAMSMGKAIIVTETPTTISYISSNIDGILVPQKNSATLRNEIKNLLTNQTLRSMIGKNARDRAVRDFSSDENISKLAEYFCCLNQ